MQQATHLQRQVGRRVKLGQTHTQTDTLTGELIPGADPVQIILVPQEFVIVVSAPWDTYTV